MPPNDFGICEASAQTPVSSFLRQYRRQMMETLMTMGVEISGTTVPILTSKLASGGTRYWFGCPLCMKRIGVIYQHPMKGVIGCRKCLGLDYKKHRYKGMIESGFT